MRLLIDTHVLIWWTGDPAQLSQKVIDLISDPYNEILVSPMSGYEIMQKFASKKEPELDRLARNFEAEVTAAHFAILNVTAAHATVAASFPWSHKDPFDRFIAAQALVETIPLVTRDRQISNLAANTIWN